MNDSISSNWFFLLTLVVLSSCMCLTSTHIFLHTCIENTQQGRFNAIFLNWLLREQGADVLAHVISSTWFVNAKLVNKMKGFTKLPVHDAIISSIYNTQDTANLVWEGNDSWRLKMHRPFSVFNCHCMTVPHGEHTMLVFKHRQEQLQYLTPECVF